MKRNSKTSILFTLSISFLIFSASSFNLIATLIEKTVLALLGADLYGLAVHGYMTEIPIANFLDEQMAAGLVEDYAFVCTPLDQVFTLANNGHSYEQYVTNPSQYSWQKISVACVPQNFLNVADTEFYYPQSLQDNVKTNSTVNGYRNAVEMLYSDDLVK